MGLSLKLKTFITILAVVFTVGLTFASLELPKQLDSFLQKTFTFPGFDHGLTGLNLSKTELYIRHFHVRTIGYVSLALVISLIIVGFVTNKTRLSSFGAIVLFLPAFGSFALSMFFLAGLGFLRLLWMPFTDLSPAIMRLGDIAYAPYKLFMYLGSLVHTYPRDVFITLCIGVGAFLFLFGTIAWFYTRFQKHNVADFFVYRVSRHPQYLGWIIWSYGILLIENDHFKKTWTYPDSLPWLLATVIIIGISLFEELRMKRQFGEEYESFARKTHFMLPLPRILKRAVRLPAVLLLRISRVERKRHVFAVVILYTVLLMAASYVYANSSAIMLKLSSSSREQQIEQLLATLQTSQSRRAKSFASMDLVQYGKAAVDPLINLASDPDPVVRDFSIQALGKLRSTKAIPTFMAALNDEDNSVRFDAAAALGELKVTEAVNDFVVLLTDQNGPVRGVAAGALARLGSAEAIAPLIESLNGENKYTLCAKIDALGRLKARQAVPDLIVLLSDDEPMIRQATAVALANIRSPDAGDALTDALDDEDWQVRIYAAEALRMIEEGE